MIYSPTCHSKTWLSFFLETQEEILKNILPTLFLYIERELDKFQYDNRFTKKSMTCVLYVTFAKSSEAAQ